MKNLLSFCITFIMLAGFFAQAQQDLGFTYQAIARDASGNPIPDKSNLQVRFSIRMGFENGPEVFTETYNDVQTNAFGLFSLQIGSNNAIDFSQIEWSADSYFLNVAVDGQDLGTEQLLSVPYSKFATNMRLEHLIDVSGNLPVIGQVLKWDGTQWIPAPDDGGSGGYQGGKGIEINGGTISNTGDTDPDDDITTATQAAGDLSGNYPDPQVTGLQGTEIDATAPKQGQILRFKGNRWTPDDDNGGTTYNAGNGISINNNIISNTGDTNASDDITTNSQAAGDVSGTFSTLKVTHLQGQAVSTANPSNGQVLKFNNGQWQPGTDLVGGGGGNYSAGSGISINGNNVISNTSPDQVVSITGNGATSVTGSYPSFIISSTDNNTTYSAGTGINIAGTTIVNTGDTDALNDVTIGSSAGGDLKGTYPNPKVDGLQGLPLSSALPLAGQVLKWTGSQWAPGVDNAGTSGATYTAGTGISISGSNVISNTGDTNGSDDITTSTSAGGDLGGTYPNPSVNALRGRTISPANPGIGHVLKWTGSQWKPEPDAGGVNYTGGLGINVSGSVITNTGDINAANDITNTTIAGGDLSGIYPNPNVDGLQGFPVASTSPQTGQVLKWSGTQWAPGEDVAGTSGSTVWTQSGNQIYYNSGGVGIGTSQPVGRLHVNANGQQELLRAALNGNARMVVHNNGGTSIGSAVKPTSNGLYVSGLTGLGTNLPTEQLDVEGNARVRGQLQIQPANSTLNMVEIKAGSTGNGILEMFGSNGNRNAILTGIGSGSNYGFLGVHDNNGTLQAGIQVESGAGFVPRGRVFTDVLAGETLELGVVPNPVKLLGYVSGDNAGGLIIRGPNNSVNASFVQQDVEANNGAVTVHDKFSNVQAGMDVSPDGLGRLFADEGLITRIYGGRIVEADTLIASTYKSFKVDHPEDPDKEIWYASVEGPEAAAYVRGTGKIVNGKAQIDFPKHFQLLIDPSSLTISITPLDASSKGLAVVSKTTEGFEVRELLNGEGNYTFDWEAKAVRKGYEDFKVIREKTVRSNSDIPTQN